MSNEPTDTFVDPNTDDLDAFASLMHGTAKEKTEETQVTQVTPKEEPEVEVDNEVDESPEDNTEEKPAKKTNRFQARIDELTAKAREAERALEALRAEREPKPETKVETTPAVQGGPNPNDKDTDGNDKYPLGEFDPSYIRDMARHTIQEEWSLKKTEEQKELTQRQIQQGRDVLQNQWVEKLTPFAEQNEDFLDKTMELEDTFSGLDPAYSDYLVQTVKSLDHGPEVLYYFANHLDEAEKFVKLGPLAATLALGEYNAMFKGQSRKETKVTKAPVPPQVNKGSNTRKTVAPDTDDLDAFAEVFFRKK